MESTYARAVALGHPDKYCMQQIMPCMQGLSHKSFPNNQTAFPLLPHKVVAKN